MRKLTLTLAAFAAMGTATLAPAPHAYAADPIYTSFRGNIAVGGYDVVSFHTGNPIKGSRKTTALWNGARWRFATSANKDAFLEAPEKYAPAYGGYCAWALAENKLAKGSPKYWKIIDGQLYLNFNKKIQARWEKDTDGFIEKAEGNWPAILD